MSRPREQRFTVVSVSLDNDVTMVDYPRARYPSAAIRQVVRQRGNVQPVAVFPGTVRWAALRAPKSGTA